MNIKITSGPNLQGYLVIALFIYWSYSSNSIWPILGFLGLFAVLVPLCIWVHKLNQRADEEMLREFPNDPYIQAKYGKK